MSSKRIIICDECGKKCKNPVGDGEAGKGWFWVKKIHAGYRAEKNDKHGGSHMEGIIDDPEDPDFCSIGCAKKWFEEFLLFISNDKNMLRGGKKWKKYKGFEVK